jgi:hypothetical protein
MDTIRYHNRNEDGFIYTEFMIQGEGRYHANLEMGFIEVPDTATVRAHMKTLKLEPMEHEPTIPVALADPRLIEQHASAIEELQARIVELQGKLIDANGERSKAIEERDRAFADKKQILEKYDVAVTKLAGQEPTPKAPRRV